MDLQHLKMLPEPIFEEIGSSGAPIFAFYCFELDELGWVYAPSPEIATLQIRNLLVQPIEILTWGEYSDLSTITSLEEATFYRVDVSSLKRVPKERTLQERLKNISLIPEEYKEEKEELVGKFTFYLNRLNNDYQQKLLNERNSITRNSITRNSFNIDLAKSTAVTGGS